MAEYVRTDEDKKIATAHLIYEYDMLRATALWLDGHYVPPGQKRSPEEQFEWNVHLESFLVHARNLMVFLHWVDKHQPAEVRAADFMRDWHPTIPKEPWVDDVYQQVCTRIVHLSYDRRAPPEDWSIRSLTEALENDVLRFINKAPAHLKDDQWNRPTVPTFAIHLDRWVTGWTGTVQTFTVGSFFPYRR